MIIRFLLWLYWIIILFSREPTTVIKPTNNLNSRVINVLEEIKNELDTVPDCIFNIGKLDDILYKSIESRFSNFAQIAYSLDYFCNGLGEQLNDPLKPNTLDDQRVTLSDTGKKLVMLCYFLTQDNMDIQLAQTLINIKSKVELLITLFSQILNHCEIDEYVTPYLERRMYPILTEVRDYVVNIKELGKTHEKIHDGSEYPRITRPG